MSIEAVNQFLTKVVQDQQLQAELVTAMEAENDRQATTELAAKHGYVFSPDELGTEIANRQSEFEARQKAGDLTEQELEAVAGGACTPAAAAAIGGVAVGAAGTIIGNIASESIRESQW